MGHYAPVPENHWSSITVMWPIFQRKDMLNGFRNVPVLTQDDIWKANL